MNTKISLMIISCLPLIVPVTLEAASHRKIVYIDQYDQDMDGRVSSIEFETSRRERFDITDTNQDGRVDAEEYVFEWEDRLDAQLAKDRDEQVSQTSTRFNSLDENKDEQISWQEYEASGLRSFRRFDSNQDGIINAEDEDAMAATVTQAEQDMNREEILHNNRRMLEMPSTHSKVGTITQYDSDGNDAVSTDEFGLVRKTFYAAMDENMDGSVTEEEYFVEFENRVDTEISRFRKESVQQAYVRFDALDGDENKIMTFKEYQISGHRSYTRWDTDGDGYVSLEETDPVEREFTQEQIEAENQST